MANQTSPLTDDIRKRVADIPGFVRWNNYKNSDYHVEVWMRFWTKVFTGARAPVLDYGCGPAWCGFVGQHFGHTVTNLDIETEIRHVDPTAYFGYFHEILGQTQDLWDGKQMPYEDNTFGAVVAKASLSKLVNSTWESMVAELVRVTQPGGRWFVAPPYMITRLKKATGVSQLKAKDIKIVSWDWGWKDPRNTDAYYTSRQALGARSGLVVIKPCSDSMILICRGKSVDKLATADLDGYGCCALVNEWVNLIDSPDIQRALAGREFIHYINRMRTARLGPKAYRGLEVKRIQLNQTQEDLTGNPNIKKLTKHKLPVVYMEDAMKEWATSWDPDKQAAGFPSTGAMAVVHAVKILGIRRLAVFGMDFFEGDYFSHHSHRKTSKVQDYQKKKNVGMKDYIHDIIKTSPDTEFVFHTYSDMDSLSNLEVR